MQSIWNEVESIRPKHLTTKDGFVPVDILSLIEIDLGLDIIPFDDLETKYEVEAALKADFTGMYVDAETYKFYEKGPQWKVKRLRFSMAHEIGHFILHQKIPQKKHFRTAVDFAAWNKTYGGKKYRIEQEANEFAGRLLVPVDKLELQFAAFEKKAMNIFGSITHLRDSFCDYAGDKIFGVNAQVIGVRLDREGIWPVT